MIITLVLTFTITSGTIGFAVGKYLGFSSGYKRGKEVAEKNIHRDYERLLNMDNRVCPECTITTLDS